MYSFCPSDYLAIRTAPEILQLTFDSEEPVDYYQVFEGKVARFFQAEAALFFPDGYLALVALLRNVLQDGDELFVPQTTDGSIPDVLEIVQRQYEGVRTHLLTPGSLSDLPESASRVILLANGDCETFGAIAPVAEWREMLLELYEKRGIPSVVILDDSLGVGLLGENYRGTLEHFGIQADWMPDVEKGVQFFFSGSLADAFGNSGGFLVGNRRWLRLLRKGEPCCCTRNQMPLSNIVAGIRALELAREPHRHEALQRNAEFLKRKLAEKEIEFVSQSELPFVLVNSASPREIVKALGVRGCRVALTHFTKKPHICIAVNAEHGEVEMDLLVQTLAELLNEEKKEKR